MALEGALPMGGRLPAGRPGAKSLLSRAPGRAESVCMGVYAFSVPPWSLAALGDCGPGWWPREELAGCDRALAPLP
eukprot:14783572-Heterocapsa_arctica.AAC.1